MKKTKKRVVVHAVTPAGLRNVCDGTERGHSMRGCVQAECLLGATAHKKVTCKRCLAEEKKP